MKIYAVLVFKKDKRNDYGDLVSTHYKYIELNSLTFHTTDWKEEISFIQFEGYELSDIYPDIYPFRIKKEKEKEIISSNQ